MRQGAPLQKVKFNTRGEFSRSHHLQEKSCFLDSLSWHRKQKHLNRVVTNPFPASTSSIVLVQPVRDAFHGNRPWGNRLGNRDEVRTGTGQNTRGGSTLRSTKFPKDNILNLGCRTDPDTVSPEPWQTSTRYSARRLLSRDISPPETYSEPNFQLGLAQAIFRGTTRHAARNSKTS